MIARHVTLVLLTATLTVFVAAVGSALAQQEANGALVAVESCTGETMELNGDETRMLDLHNQARADYGLQPLCVHPILTEAARAHSQEMLDEGYFSHDSLNGESPEERVQRFGYTIDGYSYLTYGENIAWGSAYMGTPEDRFDEWMASDDHRSNILNGDFGEVGIGARVGNYQTYGETTMYTVDFGTRR